MSLRVEWGAYGGNPQAHIKIEGRSEVLKLGAQHQVLLQGGKIVGPSQLKVGDQILAYGFDIAPPSLYNTRGRCKNS